MRLFEVFNKDGRPIACVFSDYRSGEAFCRTKSLSFLSAYDAAVQKTSVLLVKDGDRVIVKDYGPSNFDWIENVLKSVCEEYWRYEEGDEFWGDVDMRVSEFLNAK